MAVVHASLVGGALLFSILAGYGWQGSDLPRTPLSPSNAAFGIWAVIYVALAASAVALVRYDWPLATPFTALLCLSLVACGAWILLVNQSRLLSAVSITVAFAAAAAATALVHTSTTDVLSWVVAMGPGLLAGWLSVAVVLGILLAVPAMPTTLSPWWLTPSVSAALAVGAYAGNPAAAVTVGWAALFSQPPANVGLGAAAALGLVASLLRALRVLYA